MGRTFVAWGRELPLLAIVAGLVLARIRRSTEGPPPPFRLLIPLVLFALSAALSTVFSEFREESLARVAYAPIALLLFLAAQEVAVTLAAYRRLLVVLGVVVVLIGADGVYQFTTGTSLLGGSLPFRGRVSGSLPHPNDLALIPILMPVALASVIDRPAWWMSRILLAAFPVAFATAILSQSRNAWLGLAVGLGVLGAFSVRRKPVLIAGALAAALFVLAYAFDVGNVPERARKILDTPREPRIGHWLVAWEMFKEAPLLGKGVHTFGEFYLPYLDRIRLPAHIPPEIAYIPWAHNLYFEILAERGLLGAVGFAVPLGAIAVLLARALRPAAPTVVRMIALGVTAGLLSFLAQGVFDLTFLKDWVLLVFWLLAALAARLPDLEAEQSSTSRNDDATRGRSGGADRPLTAEGPV